MSKRRAKGARWSDEDKKRILAQYFAIPPAPGKGGKGKGRRAFLEKLGLSTGTLARWMDKKESLLEQKPEEQQPPPSPEIKEEPAAAAPGPSHTFSWSDLSDERKAELGRTFAALPPDERRLFAHSHNLPIGNLYWWAKKAGEAAGDKAPGRPSKWTREERAQMYAVYIAADPVARTKLLEKWGVSAATVRHWEEFTSGGRERSGDLGREARETYAQYGPEERLRMAQEYLATPVKRRGQMAARVGISKGTLVKWARKFGLKDLRPKLGAPPPEPPPARNGHAKPKAAKAAGVDLSAETEQIREAMFAIAVKTGAMKEAMAQVFGSIIGKSDKEK